MDRTGLDWAGVGLINNSNENNNGNNNVNNSTDSVKDNCHRNNSSSIINNAYT